MRTDADLGIAYLVGREVPRDYGRAFEHLLAAAEAWDARAVPWLELYRPLPPPVPGVSERSEHRPRFDGCSRMAYEFPDEYDKVPEKKVLDALCGLDGAGRRYEDGSRNRYGGFENDAFWTIPYQWIDDEAVHYAEVSEMPNFRFKPTGFEVEWYKHPCRDSHMNRDIDINGFRGILRCCIRSVLEQIDRGELRWPD